MKHENTIAAIMIFVTCRDADEAETIAHELLRRRQAACVNIIDHLVSLFHWQGKVERANEAQLVIKTRASLFESVRTTVKECHSYQTPEIIAVPCADGDRDYVHWIISETEESTE